MMKLWMRALAAAVVCCVALSGLALASGMNYADRETVTAVQEALNEAGFDCGAADGIAGSRTRGAISDYQSANGLDVTGEIADELLIALGLMVSPEERIEELTAALRDRDSAAAFETAMLNAAEASAENWMLDGELRALGSLLMAYNLSEEAGEEAIGRMMRNTYIGRDGETLVFYLCGSDRDLAAYYDADARTGGYKWMDAADREIVEAALGAVCADGFAMNDPDVLAAVIGQLSDALDS